MVYVDSAIFVKLFVDEPDSTAWRARLRTERDLVSSALAVPEFRSALRQRVGLRLLRPNIAAQIWKEFQQKVAAQAMLTIALDQAVLEECVRILDVLPRSIMLRTLDALHLASCRLAGPAALATTDLRMRAAAAALSIPLF